MKQEDWIKRLNDKLADYEEPAPADLWADIETRLAQQPAKPQSARTIPLWSKWAVAAAFVGLLLGSGYLVMTQDREMPQAVDGSTEMAKTDIPDIPMKSQKNDEFQQISAETETGRQLIETEPQSAEPDFQLAETEQTDCPPTATEQTDRQPETVLPEKHQAETILPEKRQAENILRELDQKIAEAKSRRRSHTTISLFASNDMGSWKNRNGVLMSPSELAHYDYTNHQGSTRQGDIVYLYNYEERQKHYQPISLGLTVKIPISSKISLSSGVVYTRLRSDFTYIANGYPLENQQTLHYLGIPLSVQYQLWGYKGLNVYATAGGQVDFNVEAKYVSSGTEVDFKKDRTQFSVQGALGLQYDIIPRLGIYAEPGVKYYFNNGSHVRNFFKDKPTNFNLQLGLRLNL